MTDTRALRGRLRATPASWRTGCSWSATCAAIFEYRAAVIEPLLASDIARRSGAAA